LAALAIPPGKSVETTKENAISARGFVKFRVNSNAKEGFLSIGETLIF
jgi:hypothetical protein